MSQPTTDPSAIKAAVQEHYGNAIKLAAAGGGCCSTSASCCGEQATELTLYGSDRS